MHSSNITTITQYIVKQLSSDLVIVLCNVVKFISQNFNPTTSRLSLLLQSPRQSRG